MYAVAVTFRIAPDKVDRFLSLVRENAETSRRKETGCYRFDVLTDPDRPGEVFLYELYDNRAAFDSHTATDHFREFDAAVAGMVEDKTVATYRAVDT